MIHKLLFKFILRMKHILVCLNGTNYIKEIVHVKIKILSFTRPYMTFSLLWNKYSLSNVCVHTIEVNDHQNCLIVNVLQNTIFCDL